MGPKSPALLGLSWTLLKLVTGRDIFHSHLYSHFSCLKRQIILKLWMNNYVNITWTPNRLFIPKLISLVWKLGFWREFECLFTIFRSQLCYFQPFFKGVCPYYKSYWFLLLLCIYTLFGQAIRWCKLFWIRQSNNFAPTNQIFPFTHGWTWWACHVPAICSVIISENNGTASLIL